MEGNDFHDPRHRRQPEPHCHRPRGRRQDRQRLRILARRQHRGRNVFTAGRAGADRIAVFAPTDTIRLAGFGPAIDKFAEVLAAATGTGQGSLIQSPTRSILLLAVTAAFLTADDFAF